MVVRPFPELATLAEQRCSKLARWIDPKRSVRLIWKVGLHFKETEKKLNENYNDDDC